MARRLFMHVGTPKSGTTYLQNTLWEHQKSLRNAGILLPLNGMADHWTAAKELRKQKAYDPGNRRGALKKLVAEIDSLNTLSQEDFNEQEEKLYSIKLNTFNEHSKESIIRISKSKKKNVSDTEKKVRNQLSNDKITDIAVLINILNEMLDE